MLLLEPNTSEVIVNQDNNKSPSSIAGNSTMLGWLGVLPFLLALAGVLMGYEEVGLPMFIGYSAVILSFLGGVRWAQALAGQLPKQDFLYSVIPSLLAWVCLLLRPEVALVGLALGFAGTAYLDISGRPLNAPIAFITLRLRLSLAVISLHFAVLCTLSFIN
jgi:hypothetical protein